MYAFIWNFLQRLWYSAMNDIPKQNEQKQLKQKVKNWGFEIPHPRKYWLKTEPHTHIVLCFL